jgi:tetratricopeptide (TPR) repeat protein
MFWLVGLLAVLSAYVFLSHVLVIHRDEGFVGVGGDLAARIVLVSDGAWRRLLPLLPHTATQVPAFLASCGVLWLLYLAIQTVRTPAITIRSFQNVSGDSSRALNVVSLATFFRDALVGIERESRTLPEFVERATPWGRARIYVPHAQQAKAPVLVQLPDVVDLRPTPTLRVAGIGPRTIEELMRFVLGQETVVSGDVVWRSEGKYQVITRAGGFNARVAEIDLSSSEPWGGLRDLAARTLGDLQPQLYAKWLVVQGKASEALDVLIGQPRSPTALDREWRQVVEVAAVLAYMQSTDVPANSRPLDRALEQLPNSYRLLNAKALHLLELNDLKEAYSVARRAIACAPREPAPRHSAANVLRLSGSHKEAVKMALLARHLSQKPHPAILLSLGELLLSLGYKRAASVYFREAMALEKPPTQSRIWLSYTLDSSREKRQLLEAVVRDDPDNPAGYTALGLLLADHGELVDAISAFRRATQREPKLADTHFWLGLALKESGQPDEANHEFAEARRLGSTLSDGNIRFSRHSWSESGESSTAV